MTLHQRATINDSEKQDHAIDDTSDAALDGTRAPTWLRVIGRTVCGLLGFGVVWVIVALAVSYVMFGRFGLDSDSFLIFVPVIVATGGGLLGGLSLGWFVGRGNVKRRLTIALVVLFVTIPIVIGLMTWMLFTGPLG